MTTSFGKSCSFDSLYMSFENFHQIFVYPSFHFGIKGGMWEVTVLISDHCLSIYFVIEEQVFW